MFGNVSMLITDAVVLFADIHFDIIIAYLWFTI